MPTTVIDTTPWRVTVPLKPALNIEDFHLTVRLTGSYGGTVADLDSEVLVPGYGDVHQIDWTPDPVTKLTDHLVLTVTHALRGSWLAVGPNGLPGLVTVFGDVLFVVDGSGQEPEALVSTSFAVVPATNSPLVASPGSGFQPVLTARQVGQAITATASTIGPQGARGDTGTVLSTFPVAITQDGQTVIPYPVQYPPLVPSTVHLIVNGEEYFAPDIAVGALGVTWANPAFPLEKTDRVVLRYT